MIFHKEHRMRPPVLRTALSVALLGGRRAAGVNDKRTLDPDLLPARDRMP